MRLGLEVPPQKRGALGTVLHVTQHHAKGSEKQYNSHKHNFFRKRIIVVLGQMLD